MSLGAAHASHTLTVLQDAAAAAAVFDGAAIGATAGSAPLS